MLVVNLFGAPSVGKSTMGMYLGYELKSRGIECEYVPEYAKDVVYEHRDELLNDQIYIFAQQNRRLKRLLNNNVRVAIVDAPIILSCVYGKYRNGKVSEHFEPLLIDLFNEYDNMNILLENPEGTHSAVGRVDDKKACEELQYLITDLLKRNHLPFYTFNRNEIKSALDLILTKI
jgi:nicotinamide riboside kinase